MINPERSHHAAPEAENHLNSVQGCCPLQSCTAQVSAGRLQAWIAALLHGRSGPALKRDPLSSCQHQLCPANPSGMLRGLWLSVALAAGVHELSHTGKDAADTAGSCRDACPT